MTEEESLKSDAEARSKWVPEIPYSDLGQIRDTLCGISNKQCKLK